MWSVIIGAVIGLLLVIHGFAHWQVTTLWGSRSEASSWILGTSASGLGTMLWVMALLVFLIAGIGAAFHLGWWRPAAITASLVSLVVLGLFWDPRVGIGAAVDVGVLAGLVWLRWPGADLIGA
jgi:hypothetical protein